MTLKELANHLGRSIGSIYGKAKRLGLLKYPKRKSEWLIEYYGYKLWSKDDIVYLKNNYLDSPKKKIVDTLKRPWKAIQSKANVLGLRRSGIDRKIKRLKLELTDVKKVWLAAVLDTEGSIFFHKTKRAKYVAYCPVVSVCNTDERFIRHCQSLVKPLKFSISIDNRLSQNKDQFLFRSDRVEVVYNFLVAIYPYLIIKKKQAELMMKFIELRQKQLLNHPYNACTPHTELQKNLFKQIKILNKRGK